MDKLEYIPGDLVMVKKSALQFAKDKIFKVISSLSGGFLKVVMLNDSSTTYSISNNAVRPIPLTLEILEKNGWEIVSCRDGEEIYTRGGTCRFTRLININSFYLDGTRYNTTGQWLIKYVHELQHHLWALGMNNNIKI